MSAAADCKRSLEIEIPVEEVSKATERVTNSIQLKARLPGFRPGKAPVNLIRTRFESEIRTEVLENLVPQAFRDRVKTEDLQVVGTPDISDLKFEPGQPIRFKADFEVAPHVELGQYRGLPVNYTEPVVSEEELDKRLESVRDSKADYVNIDPRPVESGDYVLVHLKSLAGLAEPIDQDVQIQVGADDTLKAFNESLIGVSPEEVKEVEITYPEEYGQEALAGKTVRFEVTVKSVRQKELPILDDEFAKDLGDFKTLDELKDALRRTIFQEKQYGAQQVAKEKLIDSLVESHDFPIPEAYVNRQIENQVRAQIRDLAGRGVDPSSIKLDWQKVREAHQEKALRNVKASLLLEQISEREAIRALPEEVDREIQRIAREEREAVAITRARLDRDGTLGRIESQIQTEKTLHFLFEQSQKQAELTP